MKSFIEPPKKKAWYLNLMLNIAKKKVGMDLLPGKILAWYPKGAIGSGVMELLAAKDDSIDERIIKLIRMNISFIMGCPFCIDMNYFQSEKYHISKKEIDAIETLNFTDIESDNNNIFSQREILALKYSTYITQTPSKVEEEFMNEMKRNFSEKEIVILAVTIAQVNYWTRLNISLGIPPAGFMEMCKNDV